MGVNYTACESCAYCAYDEEYEEYCCTADMDEDDIYRTGYRASPYHRSEGCRFYRSGDEYAVVRKQN